MGTVGDSGEVPWVRGVSVGITLVAHPWGPGATQRNVEGRPKKAEGQKGRALAQGVTGSQTGARLHPRVEKSPGNCWAAVTRCGGNSRRVTSPSSRGKSRLWGLAPPLPPPPAAVSACTLPDRQQHPAQHRGVVLALSSVTQIHPCPQPANEQR